MERLQAIHGLQQHVHQAGFLDSPLPCPTRGGATFALHEAHLWELTTWLPGSADSGGELSASKLKAAMRTLAKFHQAAADYPLDGEAARPAPGLLARLALLERLQQGELATLEHAVRSSEPSALQRIAVELLEGLARHSPGVAAFLREVVAVPLPLQWCLCDVRQEHVLFTGDRVTGLLDFGAAAVDSVAGDLARLLGSLADSQRTLAGLSAYPRGLTPEECRALAGFHGGGTLGAAANWVRWLFVEKRHFPQLQAVERHCSALRDRLRELEPTASVAQRLVIS
jgi:homoserine kinase type II